MVRRPVLHAKGTSDRQRRLAPDDTSQKTEHKAEAQTRLCQLPPPCPTRVGKVAADKLVLPAQQRLLGDASNLACLLDVENGCSSTGGAAW